jgi:hypothetical protein
MNVEQLSRNYFNLLEDCKEYYNNFTSQQGDEDMTVGEEAKFYIDFMHKARQIYHKAKVLKIKPGSILVEDFIMDETVEIDFTQLAVEDQLTILEIYEQVINQTK